MKKLSILYVLVFVVLYSCTEANQSKKEKNSTQLTLQLVDSLQFPMVADPILADVSPDGQSVLFMDWSSRKFLIYAREGELISEIEDKAGLPDDPGFYNILPGFYSDSSYVVVGSKKFSLFNFSGKELQYSKPPENDGGGIFMPFVGKVPKVTTIAGRKLVVFPSAQMNGSYPGEAAFYEKYKALEFLDFKNDTVFHVVPFDDQSLFKNGLAYIISDYWPSFTVYEDELYIAHGADPRLIKYSFDENLSPKTDTIIELAVKHFLPIEGVDMKSVDKGTMIANGDKAAIRGIYVMDDYILVNYYSGLPKEEMNELDKITEDEEWETAYAALSKIYYEKILVYSIDDLSFITELELPENVLREGIVVSGNKLWAQKNILMADEEEEFATIYRFSLVRE